jgi:hypothetical protein
VQGFCEHCNELSGSIKRWEVLQQLSNWRLLKKDSATWSQLETVLVPGRRVFSFRNRKLTHAQSLTTPSEFSPGSSVRMKGVGFLLSQKIPLSQVKRGALANNCGAASVRPPRTYWLRMPSRRDLVPWLPTERAPSTLQQTIHVSFTGHESHMIPRSLDYLTTPFVLTAWHTIFIEKLIVAKLVKEVSVFMESENAYGGYKSGLLDYVLQYFNAVHIFIHLCDINLNITHLRLALQSGLFSWDFPTKAVNICMHHCHVQKSDTGPYLQAEESNPLPHILVLKYLF